MVDATSVAIAALLAWCGAVAVAAPVSAVDANGVRIELAAPIRTHAEPRFGELRIQKRPTSRGS